MKLIKFSLFNENYKINLGTTESDKAINFILKKIEKIFKDVKFLTIINEIVENYKIYKKANYSSLPEEIKNKFKQRYKDTVKNEEVSYEIAMKTLNKEILEEILIKEEFATKITSNIPNFTFKIENKTFNIEFNKNGIDLASYFFEICKTKGDTKSIIDTLMMKIREILKENLIN